MLRIAILALLAWGSAPGAAGGDSAGSTLFLHKPPGCCWSRDDIARLRARRAFEKLALPAAPPDRVTSAYIQGTLRYYKRCLRKVDNRKNIDEKVIIKQALSDTIGSHLNAFVLPSVRLAFYAGYVPYEDARALHDFFEKIKADLNTQGLGWRSPTFFDPQASNMSLAKIVVSPGLLSDPCEYLAVERDARSCLRLPPPRLDDARRPAALVLPLRAGGVVSLVAPAADGALLKYYTAASRCLLERSTERCRHADFVHFNAELWHWLRRDVAPRLPEEKLYAALGGVLRVAAAVQAYGRGLTRRDATVTAAPEWRPWAYMPSVDSIPSNTIYICYVLCVAFAVCVLQICYNLLCVEGCSYPQNKRQSRGGSVSAKSTMPVQISSTYQKLQRDSSSQFRDSNLEPGQRREVLQLRGSSHRHESSNFNEPVRRREPSKLHELSQLGERLSQPLQEPTPRVQRAQLTWEPEAEAARQVYDWESGRLVAAAAGPAVLAARARRWDSPTSSSSASGGSSRTRTGTRTVTGTRSGTVTRTVTRTGTGTRTGTRCSRTQSEYSLESYLR